MTHRGIEFLISSYEFRGDGLATDQQPWLANPEWVRKRISGTPASNVETSRTIWLACAFALVIGTLGLALQGAETWSQKSPSFLFLLIFPIIGIALLSWNLLMKLRASRYSGAYFEMDSVPFFAGQDLTGRIHLPLGGRLRGPVQLTLNCIRRTKGATRGLTGGSKTTWDALVWRGEKLGLSPGPTPESEWSTIPVEFSIPPDAPTTSSVNPDDRILWLLRASAKLQGIDFLQYFEVPVFMTTGVTTRPGYNDPEFYAPVVVSLPAHPPSGDRQVIIRPSAGAGTEFLFLASRHWGIAKGATAGFCVWTAIFWYFFWGSDPLSFSLFVFLDVLLLYWAVWGWFSKVSAIFEDGTATVRNSLLGVGKSKQVAYSDIRQITSPIASQSGEGAEANPAYTIYLQTSSQGEVTLATGLRNAGEAGYIVERIKAEIKVPAVK